MVVIFERCGLFKKKKKKNNNIMVIKQYRVHEIIYQSHKIIYQDMKGYVEAER